MEGGELVCIRKLIKRLHGVDLTNTVSDSFLCTSHRELAISWRTPPSHLYFSLRELISKLFTWLLLFF